MAIDPRTLLKRLLGYIGEQLKEIDPQGFQLREHTGFIRYPKDLAGLPGVQCDIRLEGDYIWLQVERLEAGSPPRIAESQKEFFEVSTDPFGKPPALQEAAVCRRIATMTEGKSEPEKAALAAQFRSNADRALKTYADLWLAWAEGEKPRRTTIALYGELFALKHQVEAQETANPTELVWGIGIAAW